MIMNTFNFNRHLEHNRTRSNEPQISVFEVIFYVASIKKGTKTLDDVPKKYRQVVEERLNKSKEEVEVNADVENNN